MIGEMKETKLYNICKLTWQFGECVSGGEDQGKTQKEAKCPTTKKLPHCNSITTNDKGSLPLPNDDSLTKKSNDQVEQSGGEPLKQLSTESHLNYNQPNLKEIEHQSLPDSSFQSKMQINCGPISNLPTDSSCLSKQLPCT